MFTKHLFGTTKNVLMLVVAIYFKDCFKEAFCTGFVNKELL